MHQRWWTSDRATIPKRWGAGLDSQHRWQGCHDEFNFVWLFYLVISLLFFFVIIYFGSFIISTMSPKRRSARPDAQPQSNVRDGPRLSARPSPLPKRVPQRPEIRHDRPQSHLKTRVAALATWSYFYLVYLFSFLLFRAATLKTNEPPCLTKKLMKPHVPQVNHTPVDTQLNQQWQQQQHQLTLLTQYVMYSP